MTEAPAFSVMAGAATVNGNYRYYFNAGIIAMTMDGTALGMGRRPAAGRHGRGTRR